MFESNYNYVPNPYPQRYNPPVPPMPPAPVPPQMPPMPPHIYVDNTLSIPGAAADAYVTGKLLSTKLGIETLIGSIKLIEGKLEIDGIDTAEVGQVPSKGEDGSIEWVDAARKSDIESIRQDITRIDTALGQIDSDIDGLRTSISTINQTISDISLDITNLEQSVDNLNTLILGDGETPGIKDRLETLENAVDELNNSKLDKETFNEFRETVIKDLDDRITELEGCCDDVNALLQGISNVIGNPDNYTQPLYQTMQGFETHLQAVNRDFDGGDIDDLINVETVDIPNIIGKSVSTANLILGQIGLFTQFTIGDEVVEDFDALVIDCEPAVGETVAVGSLITLNFAEGVNG